MNKLKLGLLIPGIIAITILSCKKDNTEEPVLTDPVAEGSTIIAGAKKCLLTKLTHDDGDYETFEYDSKSRPVKENYFSKGAADGYQKITYNGNDITQEYYDKNNVKDDEIYTFKLGSNGYISSATNVYTSLNGGFKYTDTENSTLTYNTEGYLTKLVSTDVGTSNKPGYVSTTETNSYTYTYSNGNLLSMEEVDGPNTYTSKYEYYTDKKNNLPSGGDDEILNFLLGKLSTNLVKKITSTYGSNSNSSTDNYTYTFNSDGLVSKQTEISVSKQTGFPDQTYTSNYLFDYNCK